MLETPDGLTPEEQAFKNEVKEFAKQEIMPLARQIDKEDHIPMDLREKLAKKGWYGLLWPEEYGDTAGRSSTSASPRRRSLTPAAA